MLSTRTNKRSHVGSMSAVGALIGDYAFVSDSQDVKPIQESVPGAADYDAFLVLVGDGEYDEVWGMVGKIPYNTKLITRLA